MCRTLWHDMLTWENVSVLLCVSPACHLDTNDPQCPWSDCRMKWGVSRIYVFFNIFVIVIWKEGLAGEPQQSLFQYNLWIQRCKYSLSIVGVIPREGLAGPDLLLIWQQQWSWDTYLLHTTPMIDCLNVLLQTQQTQYSARTCTFPSPIFNGMIISKGSKCKHKKRYACCILEEQKLRRSRGKK